ncbi:MAG: hypothetical protein Q8Q01_03840 [archaeon]|nr:hypothetical protein [archaeon]
MITEHSATIGGELPKKDVNAKMEVFYNPVMVSNRNISIVLLNSILNKNLKMTLPLAGSGIRGLRFLKELKKGKIKQLDLNDHKDNFEDVFKKNMALSEIKPTKKVNIYQQDASLFLLKQDGYDYIDLDPFGTPNPFIAAAVARISRGGIIAVTATDTAALTGTYPKVTKRKYWARNLRSYLMHEVGLRILIRKIQLQGMQFDKAFQPILAYHKDHYFRIYFRSEKGKEKCDEIIKHHKYLLFNENTGEYKISEYNQEDNFIHLGPLWVGELADRKLLQKMVRINPFSEEKKFLELLLEESSNNKVGFYDLHVVGKKNNIRPPRMEGLLKKLKGVHTHFSPTGIKTKESFQKVLQVMKDEERD